MGVADVHALRGNAMFAIMQPLKVRVCSRHGKVVEGADYPDDSQFKVTDPNALMSAAMPSQTHAVNRSSCQPSCLIVQ